MTSTPTSTPHRYLICSTCNHPALASRETGILQTAGQLSSPVTVIWCARCGRNTTITSAEFAQRPAMTRAQIAADTCDLPAD